jgi:hypothetical protein
MPGHDPALYHARRIICMEFTGKEDELADMRLL